MTKRALAVLIACFGTVFAAYAIRYSYGTLLPEMLPYLDITKAEAGVIYSSYFIAYTILSPVLGILADRFDMRIMLSVFMAVMGLGTFLMQYPTSILQASFFFTLAGIGCAACWAPVMAVAQRWTSDKRRGLSLALVDAGSSLGVMAAGAVVPLVVAGYNWQSGWKALGIMAFVLAVVNFFCIRSRPAPPNAADKPLEPRKPLPVNYSRVIRDRRFWFIGLAYLLTGFSIIVPFTFISTYARGELAFSYENATRLVTIIGVGGITGKLLLGPLSDKVGRIKMMLLSAALIAGGILGIACAHGWSLWLYTAIFGMGYGACWALYAACASDFFSKQAAGGIVGLWTFLLGLGSISAPILAGWIADSTGTLMWSFIMASGAGLASLILLLPVLRPQPLRGKGVNLP
jgi:MFS family permease